MDLSELSSAIQLFNKQGQDAKLLGMRTYLKSVDLQGKLSIFHRLDRELATALNKLGEFRCEIATSKTRFTTGKTKMVLRAILSLDRALRKNLKLNNLIASIITCFKFDHW